MLSFEEYIEINESNMRNIALAGMLSLGIIGNAGEKDFVQKVTTQDIAQEMSRNFSQKHASKEETKKIYQLSEKDWWDMSIEDRMLLSATAKLGKNDPYVKKLEIKFAIPHWKNNTNSQNLKSF